MCTTDTLVHPINHEDNALAPIRFESIAIGQLILKNPASGDFSDCTVAGGCP